MIIRELKELLDEFLNRWTIDDIRKMTLQEYVGIGNKDTFCQWVETRTRKLGSIKGGTSFKFVIYERKDFAKRPMKYKNDEKYSWLKSYGENRTKVFEKVKSNIIKTIELSEVGKFEQIDHIELPDLFKWKIAFLYSNERLIPIYKRDVLSKIAKQLGLSEKKQKKISEIQNLMMFNKPTHLNVYEFMRQLYDQFGENEDYNETTRVSIRNQSKRLIRRATSSRNTLTQIRTVTRSYIAEQKHNKIQKALESILIKKYGQQNVILEENFVDIKLLQPEFISFYEVKSSSYASECIKEALGQILLYSLNDNDKRPKKHIIVGQYAATENDQKFIDFLKKNLKLQFEYISVEIE